MLDTEPFWPTKNPKSGKMGKESLNVARENLKVPHTNFQPTIDRTINEKCQELWHNCVNKNQLNIQPMISERHVKFQKDNERAVGSSYRAHTHYPPTSAKKCGAANICPKPVTIYR